MGLGSSRVATAAWVLVASVLSGVLPTFGQQDTAASLTIGFANGQTRYHVGEIIPLELAFAASTENTYETSTRQYDRSGRLNLEEFHVIPPGRDPLHNYYEGGLFGGSLGGGLSSGPRFLESQPQIIREDLNECVVLDRPGQYDLYVTSARVTRRGEVQLEPLQLRSNTLNFEVIEAHPGWLQQTLDSAVMMLENSNSTQEEKQSAFRTLRFLDSPGSIQQLVRQLGKPDNTDSWDCIAGLMGSSRKQLVLRELEANFAATDAAITESYVLVLAASLVLLNRESLPAYPQQDKQRQSEWEAQFKNRMAQVKQVEDALYDRALALVGTKQGPAEAETVRALLLRPYTDPSQMKPLSGLPTNTVASAFLLLSPDEEATLLQLFWSRLNVPAMAGALEKILDQPQIHHQQLRDLAMRRLYELDPTEGATRIMAEIRQPHVDEGMFSVSGKTLGMLPNKTLPQLDDLLGIRLAGKNSRTMDLDAQLIGRYATKAILSRVKAVYETAAGKWDCAIEDGLISYFLRIDADYGVERLKEAGSSCTRESVEMVVRMKRWAEIEPAIIRRLNHANLWSACDAAEMLARYGSVNAEKAMWERLRSFHRQWAEREEELQQRPNMPQDDSDAVSFQFGLVESLGKAQGWLLDNNQITELENLTLGQERDNVASWHWHSPLDLSLNVVFDDQLQASINGQWVMNDVGSLRAKLAQFPNGTRFRVTASQPCEQLAAVIAAISQTAEQHGFVVESQPIN